MVYNMACEYTFHSLKECALVVCDNDLLNEIQSIRNHQIELTMISNQIFPAIDIYLCFFLN